MSGNRHLFLAQGRLICQVRAGGVESRDFWYCMDEYRQEVGRTPER